MAKYLCIWVRAYWFSVTSFSKWLPGGHIRFFGFWMAWFRQRNSSLLWNFSFKFHVHVLCGCRQKPNDCQLRFQNGCLVILNNVQLQSTHCPLPPSPMGRGYPSRSLIYNFLVGSDNGLSPDSCQGIIWTNAGIVLIGPWGTYFNEILIKIQQVSFRKVHLKMLSGKWRPFCLGLNVLMIFI